MRNKRGFSLLEILIALALMLVGIVGTMLIFPAALRSAKVAGNLTRATILGEKLIEDIKKDGYPAVTASGWTQFTTSTATGDDTDFWWEKDVTATGVSNLRQVEIKIGWDDRGTSHTSNYLSFITYAADK
jgi:prepilin-type N-terminal cleavage/methylation domain-containing protein